MRLYEVATNNSSPVRLVGFLVFFSFISVWLYRLLALMVIQEMLLLWGLKKKVNGCIQALRMEL